MTIQSFAGPPPKIVHPDNVIAMNNVVRNTGHPAAHLPELPAWFIKPYTDPGDLVPDPLMGSGTTLVAAAKPCRRAAGIDTVQKYCDLARGRIAEYAAETASAGNS